MNSLAAVCDFLGLAAGLAVIALVGLFVVLACTRKSSSAWINIQFSLVATAIGSECLSNVYASHLSVSVGQLWIRILVSVAILACTILSIPIYRRVRRHPNYDEVQAANRQLAYSQRLFRTFLDETPFATYVADSKDRLVYVNTRLARVHNTTTEEMVNTTLDRWFPADISARLAEQNAQVLCSSQKQEFVNEVILASGKATFLSYKFPLPGPSGEKLLGSVSLEISEELRSKAADTLLALIVELSPDAIYTFDEARCLTSWNQAAEQLFGYSADEIIGQPVTILVPSKHVHLVDEVMNRLSMGENIQDKEVIHLTKEGQRKHLTLSATKIKSFLGVGASYAAIARDQTGARQAENQMVALNEALDNRILELSQINEVLPAARDQALEALDIRTAFVVSMSHAIRTPLSGILGVSELLLDKERDQETTETIKAIFDCALALPAIVNDLVDVSKLNNDFDTVEEKPFSPAALLRDCVRLVQPNATNKKIKITTTIDINLPPIVLGNQSRVRQVLFNLIGNAVKFTAQGTIATEAKLLSDSGGNTTIQFIVADSGIGIAAHDKDLLFTPFSRIGKSTKGIKGSGLGLAISKRLVDMMGGSIDFQSTVGEGSLFKVTLPFKKAVQLQQEHDVGILPEGPNERDLLSKCRILIVEDSRVISMLTLRQLAKFDINAEQAATGQEALEKIQQNRFDVVLMDVNLPDLSGCEVTAKIREMEGDGRLSKHIIIALTAGGTSGAREEAMASGMDDFFVKPVQTLALKEALVRWLEARLAWI